jgi:serine protease Do
MLKNLVLVALALGWSVAAVVADTIQLKGKAAVIGTVLAEKRDAVVVDLGYTVLVIPRNQISRITMGDGPESKPSAKTAAKSSAKPPTQPFAAEPPYEPPGVRPSLGAATRMAHHDVAAPEAGRTPVQGDNPRLDSGSSSSAPDSQRSLYVAAPASAPVKNVRELVDQLGETVVQVKTPSGLGSGFFIHEDGFLLTNFHVIEGETQILVEVYLQRSGQLERRNYKQVRIVALNKFEDIALLKIEDKEAPKFARVRLGSSDELAVGERVFAIGSPLGLERTVTEGILSTKTRQLQGELYLQTTAQINPGNSGGPLFNLSGDVVGITNMKITFGEGLGFAIPIEAVKFFLEHRDAYAYSNDNPSNPYRYLEPPSRTKRTLAGE